jgi:hypothetical protein
MGEMICLRDLRDFKIFSGSETGEVCLSSGLFLVFFRPIASLLIMESPSEKIKVALEGFLSLFTIKERKC